MLGICDTDTYITVHILKFVLTDRLLNVHT